MNENGFPYNNYSNNNYNNAYAADPRQQMPSAQPQYGQYGQPPFAYAPPQPPAKKKTLPIVLLCVGAALIIGMAVLVGVLAGQLKEKNDAADTIVVEETAEPAADAADITADAAEPAAETEESAAEPAQEGLTWTLEDHVLTISGSGDMNTLADADGYTYPWTDRTEEIMQVVIEDGVTTVGAWAFANCGYLANAAIPDSVTEIGDFAFDFCWELSGVELPDSVTRIGKCAFEFCACLPEVTIPEGVTEIGEAAFNGCSAMKSITIPVSVTEIGEDAFTACGNLADVQYAGSESDWNAIGIGSGNEQLTGANISFG